GRGRRGLGPRRLGRSAGRTRHPPGLPTPGRAAGQHLPVERLGVQAVPAARRVFADPRPRHRRRALLMATLAELRPGGRAEVLAVTGDPGLVQRFYEFGVMEGETVEVVALAPLGDPIEIRLGNTRLSL